jgi:hypothetical protein
MSLVSAMGTRLHIEFQCSQEIFINTQRYKHKGSSKIYITDYQQLFTNDSVTFLTVKNCSTSNNEEHLQNMLPFLPLIIQTLLTAYD